MRPTITNGSSDLGTLTDSVGFTAEQDPAERRAAAVTTADHAITNGLTRDELRDLLEALGLDNLQEVPC